MVNVSETTLRARLLLAKYQWLFALVAVALLVGGIWLSYGVYAGEPEVEEVPVTNEWSIDGEFVHSAAVEEENEVFPVGTVLANEPLYYTSLSPVVDGRYNASYAGTEGEDVTITVTVDLLHRAVDDDVEYWNESETLASESGETVDPGEPVTADVSINVTTLDERIGEIEESLGASPGTTETVLAVETSYDGEFGGEGREITRNEEIEIDAGGETYSLQGGGFSEEFEYETGVETEEAPPSRLEAVVGPLAAVVGAAALLGLGLFRHRGLEPTDADREWLAYRQDLAEFDDLITRVELPEAALDRPEVPVASLGQLSRFAIDVESAIVEDRQRNQYVVRDPELLYVYTPPAEPTRGEFGDTGTSAGDADSEGDDGDSILDGLLGSGGGSPKSTAEDPEVGISDETTISDSEETEPALDDDRRRGATASGSDPETTGAGESDDVTTYVVMYDEDGDGEAQDEDGDGEAQDEDGDGEGGKEDVDGEEVSAEDAVDGEAKDEDIDGRDREEEDADGERAESEDTGNREDEDTVGGEDEGEDAAGGEAEAEDVDAEEASTEDDHEGGGDEKSKSASVSTEEDESTGAD